MYEVTNWQLLKMKIFLAVSFVLHTALYVADVGLDIYLAVRYYLGTLCRGEHCSVYFGLTLFSIMYTAIGQSLRCWYNYDPNTEKLSRTLYCLKYSPPFAPLFIYFDNWRSQTNYVNVTYMAGNEGEEKNNKFTEPYEVKQETQYLWL